VGNDRSSGAVLTKEQVERLKRDGFRECDGSVFLAFQALCDMALASLEERQARERWITVSKKPLPDDQETYLVSGDAGHVAPRMRGVIYNNVGTPWDWNYG
jgi:hypothetical protein